MRIALTLDRDASRAESNDYIRALLAAGLAKDEIAVVPPGAPVNGSFDGLLLGGGCDVDPGRYGRALRPNAGVEVDAERDATDFAVFDEAWRRALPILGICRGLQVVNVALGGTLVQDLPSQKPSPIAHRRSEKDKTRRDHAVRLTPGTRLSKIARTGEIPVNSRHHQAIETLADSLRIAATAPDGVIEAIETGPERWLLRCNGIPKISSRIRCRSGSSRNLLWLFGKAVSRGESRRDDADFRTDDGVREKEAANLRTRRPLR
ncbi:MAG TPA: gamma-glutamyl-gamma-aminobutyrate hydrolase family protein [Thermoanaerobaculia bacterium]|nr:gamma-glutamyl-gamma-aminobutyrate hydrolase family protein [Thermoanaerobaculia bacterium]